MFAKVRQMVLGLLILVSLTNPVSDVQARVPDQDLSPAPVATDPIPAETSNPPTDTFLPSPVPANTTMPTSMPNSILTQSPDNPVPSRPTNYYLADRVINNADFAKLAGWGINTAIVDFDVNGAASSWRAVFTSAAAANINVVIWPSDWNDPRPNCGWEAPYPISATGDITKVKPLIDVASQYSNFIGIVNAHESFWTCTNMTFNEMAGLKDQLKAYALSKGRAITVWNYIDNLYDTSMLPDNQIQRIMDVAVTWQHCAGNAEGTCNTTSSSSALNMILSDRKRIADSGAQVELVFLMQTFATGEYSTKFTLSQLQDYSCQFLNTSALDGFGFYTWHAGWWSDLHSWPELQPAVQYIYNSCTTHASTLLPPVVTASDGTDTTGVNVSWTASSGATSYLAYRSDSPTGVKIPAAGISAPGLNGVDTWAIPGVTYIYWVRACGATGCSDFSAPETGWRKLAPPVVTASDGAYTDKVQVSWTASSGAATYVAYRSDSPGGVKIPTNGLVTANLSGADMWATSGVTYYYWIKACNLANCSDFSGYDTGWR